MTISGDIIEGIKRNDKNAIGNNFTIVSQDGWGLLHYAAKFGSLEVAKFLVNDQGVSFNTKTNDGNKPIHIAADFGHKNIVKFFLDKGVEVDEKGKDNWTPLHYATNKGYLEIVKLLIEKQQHINSKTMDQSTPLHYAAKKGHLSIVEFLIARGAEINVKNSDNETPLKLANDGGHEEVASLLRNELLLAVVKKRERNGVETQLDNGANINYASQNNGWMPLHYAVDDSPEDLNFIKFLTEKGADINAKDSDGNKPLHIASDHGYRDIVNFFLDEKGLSVNDQGKDSWTPLHYAANKTHLELGKALVEKEGIDINARDKGRKTPLHHAASKGYLNFVKFLVGKGANINAEDAKSETPLQLTSDSDVKRVLLGKMLIDAVKQNNIQKIREYIGIDHASVDYSSEENKWTPLHYAASLGYRRSAELLVNNSTLGARDSENNTPLHIAADYGKENIVELLLERGADINIEGKNASTPLHYAADKGNFRVAKLLVERGANIDTKNSNQKSPSQLAKDKNHQTIVKLLLNKALINSVQEGNINEVKGNLDNGAEINHSDRNGWTPLHHATNRTSEALGLIRLLVKEGANVNATTHDGNKPLHLASRNAYKDTVKFFINEKGLDINDRGEENFTPLHYAVNKESEELVRFLIKKEADIYAENSNSKTPLDLAEGKVIKGILLGKALIDAVKRNDITKVSDHIKKGANVDYSYEDRKWTSLHYTGSLGYQRSAKVLVRNNATIIDAKDSEDSNPLHIAAEYGHKNIVEFFLKNPREHLSESKAKLLESEGKNGWTLLHYATDKGHLAVVKFLIETGANIATKGLNDETPLQIAEEKGNSHKEVAKLLRSRALFNAVKQESLNDDLDSIKIIFTGEIDVNYSGLDNWTPLHYAASNGDLKVVEFLVEKGADVNTITNDREKPIHVAAKHGHTEVVEFFIERKGLSVDEEGKNRWTPLHYAVSGGKLELTEFLIKKGANINAESLDSSNKTPLQLAQNGSYEIIKRIVLGKELIDAVKRNDIEKVRDYITSGADLNYSYEDKKWTPLHYAAHLGYQSSAEVLINNNSTVIDTKDSDNNEPLHIATACGHENIVKLLLKNEKGLLSVNNKGKSDWRPLHYAAEGGHLPIVKFLIEKKADINAVNSDGKTPLELAREREHQEIVSLLLNEALFEQVFGAVKKGNLDEVKGYLDAGANVNHSDLQGWTPLHHAANRTIDDDEFVRFLVEKGANIDAKTNDGNKPLHIASSHAHINIVRFFVDEKELDINDRGKDNWTPLHHAVHKDSESFAEFLIKKGANIYAEDYNNITPLKLADGKGIKPKLLGKALIDAVRQNNVRKVRDYIKEGAKVDYSYEDNKWTPLHYAASLGYQRSAETLINNNANITDAKDADDSNPLHIAIAHGRKNIVEFFLQEPRETLIESKGKDDWTPLHYAAYENQLPVVKFLIEKGANIDATGLSEETPLQLAVEKGDSHREVAKLLRSRALFNTVKQEDLGDDLKGSFTDEIDVNYSNSSNWTPLHHAALNGYLKIVKFLIEKGANVDARTDDRDKPLHYSAKNGHKNVVKFFLEEKGLSVDELGKENWTPLHYATLDDHFDVVEYLVKERGANIDARSVNGTTPLDLVKSEETKVKEVLLGKALVDAVKQNIVSRVSEYINKGANVNYSYEENLWTPLHYAAKLGHQGSATKLIESNSINVNAKNSDGDEPIHLAAAYGHKDVVELLLEKEKASINHKGKSNWTSLHYAAKGGHLPVVQLLIEKEADANLKNSDGKTPLQLARDEGHQSIAQLLLNKGLFNAVKVIGAVKEGDHDKVEEYLSNGISINHSDQNGWSLLHHAANREVDDLEFIRFLVEEKGANVNAKAHSGDKPLHIASGMAYKDIVEFFLNEKGMNVNDRGKDNWTPLHHAVNKGSSDLVKFLIKKEADIYAENSNSVTPLDLAQQLSQGESNRQEVKAMLQGKALIDAIRKNDVSKVRKYIQNLNYSYEKNGWQPLHYAASLGYKTLATELINKDPNVVNAKDSDGNTPLHLAATYGKGDVVELFLSKQANIDEVGKNNWTPLHYAVYENRLPVVKFLIEKGANIGATGLSGETPLQLAVEKGDSHREVAKLLRSRELFNAVRGDNLGDDINKIKGLFVNEIDVNYSDLNNWTPLHYAARNGYTKVAEFLVEKKANINARTDSREKPLHIAAKNGHKDIVEFFIDQQELSVNEQGENKWTPLHYAAASNSLNVVQYLIEEKEATIDSKDRNNWTALHHASKEGHIEIVKFLIKKGANINAHNSQGKLPVDLASEPEVIQFLLNEGLSGAVKQNKVSEVRNYLNKEVKGIRVNIDYSDQNGRIFLHHAARHGYSDVVELLVQSWPAVNATDLNNWTPLHYASEGGHLKIVKLLTRERADINIRNSDEDKPLHVAAKSGHQPIVRFFIDERGMDINDLGRDNWTPLHYASANNYSQIVNFLVKEGADITIQNAQGKAPLELITGNQEIVRSLQNEALFDAVEQGEYAQVQKYLDNGADPNSLSGNDWTLLHRAAEKGHLLIASLLVERGASIDAENSDGDKSLHIASQYGHINIVKLLLNGKVNDKGKDNKTPLHYAAESNHFEVVRYLVGEKGADINLKDADGDKPMHLAAKNGHTDIVKFFLDKKLSVNDLGKDSWTPLHYAAEQGKSEVVELLITRGANINAENSGGKTPLQLAQDERVKELLLNKALFDAVKEGNLVRVQDSFRDGANVNSTNRWGWGLLHAASVRNNLPLIRSLVEEKGANINAKSRDGDKPLHIAAEKGSLDVVRYFLSRKNGVNEADANINDRGKNNWTPLHYAAKYNHPEVAEFLIENGADINAIDYDNLTPLQLANEGPIKRLLQNKTLLHAVKQGNLNDVERYLDNGANVNYSDKNGWTVLHEAASRGHLRVAQALISRGANINTRDQNGDKPLHIAADYGRRNVVEFFLKEERAGLSVNDANRNGWTPLHYAASRGGLAIVELLITKRANINAQDSNGNKPLHIAADNGHRSIIEFFLRWHGDELSINDKGNNDWTMLHYAADKGYPEVVKFLIEKGADIDAKSTDNKTPLQLASGKNHQEAARLLRNKALFNAVKQGELSKVEQYLAEGADPNYKDENDWTLLHDAASKGYIEIVRLLKAQGANVDAKSYNAKPLHYAARNGYEDIVAFLIVGKEKSEGVDSRGRNNWTPLHYAARHGRLAVVEFLIGEDADINLKDTNRNKPLHVAAQYGHTNVMEFFLRKNREGLSIDDKGISGKTALHQAAEKSHSASVEFLIEKGADINIQDSEENTPLQLATDPEIIKLLQDKVLFNAVKQGDRDKISEYLTSGADVDVTNRWGWGMLHIAAENGDLSMIRFLQSKGANLNMKSISGESPLHVATKNGYKNVAEFLLEHGVSASEPGKNNKTPLHYAAEEGYFELVKLLIEKRADTNARDSNGKTPLQLAKEKENGEITELLLNEAMFHSVGRNDIQRVKDYLKEGADVNYSSHNNWTPLHYAAYRNHIKLIKLLVEEGANVNAGSHYIKPLHIAAQYGHKGVVEFLLNSGSNINASGWNSWTPLHYAADSGHSEVVKLLIEREADINVQDFHGKTPLQLATEKRHLEVVKTLSNAGLFDAISQKDFRKVEHYFNIGADVNSRDDNDLTPLHKAAQCGDLEIVKFLLRKKAYTNARNNKDYLTPLHEAAKSGNLEVVKLLINFRSNIHDQTISGAKPLHIAAEYGHKDIVEFFLNRRLSVNDLDKNKWTPLHYAAKSGNLEVIKFLISRGADINAKDSNNLKPLHIAAEYGHKGIVEFFTVEKQLSVSDQDKSSKTLMHYAAKSGNLNVIEFFAGRGANIIAFDINGVSPLHIAAEHGHKNAIEFFLSRGLNVNYQDQNNQIPLHYAAKGGSLEVVKLLVSRGANVNAQDSSNAKPLHYAAQYGHKDIVEFFVVQKQLSVDDKGKDNWTPLYYAAKGRNNKHIDDKLLEVIRFLVRQDRNIIKNKDVYGAGPLHIAAQHGHKDIVEFFIQKELNVNDADYQQLTPLHYAALHGRLRATKSLVEEGADIRAVSNDGKKPIHSAASNAHKNIVLFFVQQGLSINDPDTNLMWTPLHYAAHSGNLDFVQSLLAEGANFNAVDADNAKPLHIAAERGYQKVIELLINQGMNVNDLGQDNWTPLHYAARHGHLGAVRFLVEEKGANINAVDLSGKIPLHIAAENGHKDIVKFFLDKGISVNAVSADNWTPLHCAASNGHLETVKFLVEEKGADIDLLSIDHEKPLDLAISANHVSVVEYLRQALEEKEHNYVANIRHSHLFVDQPTVGQFQSSGAGRHSSLIGNWVSWIKGWIPNTGQPFLPGKVASCKSSTPIIQERLGNISNADMMLYYVLYSWFNGNKCNMKCRAYESSTLSKEETIGCTLRIVEKLEQVMKQAACSSGIAWKSVRIDFLEVQKTITAKITSGNYDTIASLLDSYVEKAFSQNLSQKQIDGFKKAYNGKKDRILNSADLQIQASIQVPTSIQSVLIEKGITNEKSKETCYSLLK
ncbi:ankyrin repeat domain-containing protein [Wolbachia endosymbiont (group B) of Chorthippus parallelus]|uniref:ankyrin repeat domain-containing protein n=1 Tax=Wolbachia endosymbiont (group B) of Chorthippus parallelus TaxID=2953997 RepID=UPI00222FCB89|nr:ankyrin repeat domain-containing protein [Wolbachia endosymbiont (group B) of Chorthippus parallelus]